MRPAILAALAVFVLAASITGAIAWQAGWLWPTATRIALPDQPGVIQAAPVGGPFQMVDQDGRTVGERELAGRLSLIFFGYRYCPDFCPNELQKFAEVMDLLGPDAAKVQPVFVSIDPERDRPADLKEYVALFDPRLMALTGTPEQVATMARAWRVYYGKAKTADTSEYLMDHSTYSYLMAPDATTNLAVFSYEATPEVMAETIRAALKAG